MRPRRSSSTSPDRYGYPFQPARSVSPDFTYGQPEEDDGLFYHSQRLPSLYGGYPPPYPSQQQQPQPQPPQPTYSTVSVSKKRGNNDEPVVVAIMGATGSGKSTFLTACGGVGFQSGHSLASETKEPVEWNGTYKGVPLTLVDTPGFGDTNLPDSVILEKISQWLQKNFEEGKKINGIIYLHRITDNRMTHIGVKNIKMFKNLCGPNAMKNAILCTSFWDTIDKQVGEDRERELRSNYWKNMIGLGATIERHDNTKSSATRILDKILSQNGVSLKLQEELAEGKKLGETVAGRTIIEDVGEREIQLQKVLRELKQDYDNALEERDAEMKRMIEEERERMFEQIRVLEEDKLRLEQRLDEIQSKVKAPGRFSRWAKKRTDAVFKAFGFELRRLPPS